MPWEIKFGSRWRSGLGFNSVSSSSVVWVSVPMVVNVESGGDKIRAWVELVGLNWLGLTLNRLD